LNALFSEQIRLVASGRTDAGVHALGQVANFHVETSLTLQEIKGALNSLLPDDVVIHQVEEVPLGFHSRFDAKWRTYRYRLARRKKAVGRDYLWYVKYKLDVGDLRRACRSLIGTHDFSSFSVADHKGGNHICQVFDCKWEEEGEELYFEIRANRFLHHMVRTIVGTMVDVGRGRIKPQQVEDILAARDRSKAGTTAPARGLCLVEVGY